MIGSAVWPASIAAGGSLCLFGLWFLSRQDARLLDFGLRNTGPESGGAQRSDGMKQGLFTLGSVVLWIVLRKALPPWASTPTAAVPAWLLVRLLARSRAASARQGRIEAEWPLLLESMSVAALSGLGLNTAFELAAKRVAGPLRLEAEKVILRVNGGLPLSKALETLVRERVPGADRLASVLLQCEMLGTPVAGVLESLAQEASNLERQSMEAKFNSLPLKLSLITVVFLLPPVLVVSIAPHVLVFLNTKW